MADIHEAPKKVRWKVTQKTFINGSIAVPGEIIVADETISNPALKRAADGEGVAPNPPLPQSAGIDPQLAAATARVAELEAALADKDKQIAAAQIAGEGAIARVAELEAQIAAAAKPQAGGNGGKAQK